MSTVHSPLAFCPDHGVFSFRGVQMLGNVQGVTFMGSVANCPKCNKMVEMLPGTYNIVGDRLDFLIDPSISAGALKALMEIAQKVQRAEITIDEAERQAAAASGKFKGFFAGLLNLKQETVAILLAGLLTAGAAVWAAKIQADAQHPPAQTEQAEQTPSQSTKAHSGATKLKPKKNPRMERLKNSTAPFHPSMHRPSHKRSQ